MVRRFSGRAGLVHVPAALLGGWSHATLFYRLVTVSLAGTDVRTLFTFPQRYPGWVFGQADVAWRPSGA